MKKVLIVEDDPTIARIYQGLLRMDGVEAEVAQDGEVALECLARQRPDLVLLDLMLPKKNGIHVLKHIRSHAALQNLPVIVFTNAYMGSLMGDALKSGATHCVAKAQSRPKQVVETIRGYLSVSSSTSVAAVSEAKASGEKLASPPPRREECAVPKPIPPPSLSSGNAEKKDLAAVAQGLSALRSKLLTLAKSGADGNRLSQWSDLCLKLDLLTRDARSAELGAMVQLAGALNALAGTARSANGTDIAGTLRTLAQGVDCLDLLLGRAAGGQIDAPKRSVVLVLDDDAVTRRLISGVIERVGLRCISLSETTSALKVILSNTFDLVFLDVDMPGTNGFDLCKEVRASATNRHTPVIFVTGLTNLESRALSIMSGADDFVRKPFCPADLAVRALLHIMKPRTKSVPSAPNSARAEAGNQPAVIAQGKSRAVGSPPVATEGGPAPERNGSEPLRMAGAVDRR